MNKGKEKRILLTVTMIVILVLIAVVAINGKLFGKTEKFIDKTNAKVGKMQLSEHSNTATTYNVVYIDGVNGRVFGDETHGNLKAGETTPQCLSSTNRTGYTFMGWTPAVKSTVDPDMADENGRIIYTATWKKIQITYYRIYREYYINGELIAKTGSAEIAANVGEIIKGEEVSNHNINWNYYIVNGVKCEFTYTNTNPETLTLSENISENTITLRYERNV